MSPFKYYEYENLPEFLINEKTELHFYPYENKYKLYGDVYIFKYPKNEFQNLFNNKEILNIITNNLLDKFYIIEQYNLEYICFHSNSYNIDYKMKKSINKKNNNLSINKQRDIEINIPNRRIKINIPDDDISYTEDKLEFKTIYLNMNK